MLDSRLRKYAKKDSSNPQTQIFDDLEYATTAPTQHCNRATAGLLKQAFETAEKKLFLNHIDPIIENLRILKETKNFFKYDYTITLNEYRDLLETIKEKKEELKKARNEKQCWLQQCSLLKPGKLTSLIQANRLLKRPPEIYLFNAERCERCHIPFEFDPSICRYQCIKCSILKRTLFQIDDTSSDTLILKAKTTGVDNPPPKMTINMRLKMQQTQDLLDHQRSKKITDSINNYKEFLTQFKEGLPPVSNEVRAFLALRLFPVHVCGKSKCKLPTIRSILKESKQFSHLEKQAERIRRDYVGEQIPVLQQDVIERLIERYSHLLELATIHKKIDDIPQQEMISINDDNDNDDDDEDNENDSPKKKQKINQKNGFVLSKKKEDIKRKIFQQEVITMMLLLIDGNRDEAFKFFLHKTRTVLNECNECYLELVSQARKEKPYLWPENNATLL